MIKCWCGAAAIALCAGTDPEFGHPPDMFGFPDLSAKPVVMIAGVPDQAWCGEHWRASWTALERGVAHV